MREIRRAQLAYWVIDNPKLVTQQKIAISTALAFCVLSTAVCAPMGGEGGKSLFHTKSPAAYWPFFFLSPILILMLCGRAFYRLSKMKTAPLRPRYQALFNLREWNTFDYLKAFGFFALLLVGGSINAYNTLEYIPYGLAYICFVPALLVPGYVMVNALIEFHRRIFHYASYFFQTALTRRAYLSSPSQRLQQSARAYRQMNYKNRLKVNALFSHPAVPVEKKLRALFNPYSLLNLSMPNSSRSSWIYALGVLGFLIGIFSEFYSYSFGKKMASPVNSVVAVCYGVLLAYVRMGISAVATSDVFGDMADDIVFSYRSRSISMNKSQAFFRGLIILLAVAASMPNVQNQIKTRGHEEFFGYFLSICAIIAPACTFFWAGDLVHRDWLYQSPGLSYSDSFDRLNSKLPEFTEECADALPDEDASLSLACA